MTDKTLQGYALFEEESKTSFQREGLVNFEECLFKKCCKKYKKKGKQHCRRCPKL